ncbi:MAG: lactate racemase domain-containing protein [Chloroflexaceae bacterium]
MQLNLAIEDLASDISLPPLYRARQCWDTQPLTDVAAAVRAQLDAVGLRAQITPGMRVAVTAGSRGIRDMVQILQTSVAWLKEAGAEPFIVPAMGSHGGATAAGQVRLLADLGVTAATMGCPIQATMEVVELGHMDDGTPVYLDRHAATADGVLVVNRIKPHTSFKADIESGIAKMCAVGLGKRLGAEMVHRRGVVGLRTLLVPMARMVVSRGKVLAGLALLEDAREQTAAIVALPPAEIGGAGEAHLLERSKVLMARLPFDQLDVLVVDAIGKNISGTGMDTNVIGRLRIPGEPEPATPRITVIVALDLTEASHGNATGVGLADLIPAHLAQKIDFAATYINNITSGLIGLRKGALPITLPTSRAAIATALRMCGQPDLHAIRLARIPNTLLLEELLVSPALLPEVAAHPGLELLGPVEWTGVDE